jgi:hypothetical protein
LALEASGTTNDLVKASCWITVRTLSVFRNCSCLNGRDVVWYEQRPKHQRLCDCATTSSNYTCVR